MWNVNKNFNKTFTHIEHTLDADNGIDEKIANGVTTIGVRYKGVWYVSKPKVKYSIEDIKKWVETKNTKEIESQFVKQK